MNEFVKNKAQDFKLKPKDGLWDNIEKELDKKKKRRAIYWFLPIVFLLGMSCSYMLFNLGDGQKVARQEFDSTLTQNNHSKANNEESNTEIKKDQKAELDLDTKTEKNQGQLAFKKEATTTSFKTINKNKKKKKNVTYNELDYKFENDNNSLLLKKEQYLGDKIKKLKLKTNPSKSAATLSATKDSLNNLEEEPKTVQTEKQDTLHKKLDLVIKPNMNPNIDPVISKWEIGIYGGLGMTNHYSTVLQKKINATPATSNSNDLREDDKALMGFNYGININKKLKNNFEIQVSLGHSSYSWRTLLGDSVTNMATTFNPPDIENFAKLYQQSGQEQFDNNFKTISTQLNVQKTIISKGNFDVGIQLGMGYERIYDAQLLYYSHYSNVYARTDEKSSNYKKGFFTSSLSVPFNFKTKGKTTYWLSPSFKTSINSYLNSNFEKQHPHFYGILAGIKYNL